MVASDEFHFLGWPIFVGLLATSRVRFSAQYSGILSRVQGPGSQSSLMFPKVPQVPRQLEQKPPEPAKAKVPKAGEFQGVQWKLVPLFFFETLGLFRGHQITYFWGDQS